MKIFILILILILAGGFAAGYRVHPENLSYYMKLEKSGPIQSFTLNSGQTLEGEVVEETADAFKINVQGATMKFSKSELISSKSASPATLFEQIANNYKKNYKIHPLISKDKTKSLGQKFDNFMTEPGKIADDIKNKNPHLSTESLVSSSTEAARAVQAQARALQAQRAKEIEEMERG